MKKTPTTLTLEGLSVDDHRKLAQLIRGLQFHRPVIINSRSECSADIVFVDADELSHSPPHDGKLHHLILIDNQSVAGLHPHCIHKPFRAREVLNCINAVLKSL